ncbi:MAG TPA: potassium-transporting ATPase subunit KdpB, partial [Hyphomicrobiaceae bacterium]|nr:potassium-transporting ATPase subunit KdpB [Hyphomicrobiaceae bacterium]
MHTLSTALAGGSARHTRKRYKTTITDGALVWRAVQDAFRKLSLRALVKNPVIFTTAAVSALVTVLFIRDLATGQPALFSGQIAAWLWFTVLFANFAEAIAEGRGRAQADTLRRTREETRAKRILMPGENNEFWEPVDASQLRPGEVVLVEAGDTIPGDGEVIEGVASVNEAAITGESAPVIREAGGDRSAVTGGTTVISDWIVVRITSAQGSSFLDRMIALVEGAERQRTPNEIALNILLAGLTIVFLVAVVTLTGLGAYSGTSVSVPVLVALFVTLIPTTIGGLLAAIGIAGMDRLLKFNVLAMSGRAVEAAGDVDTLLLDKTGTITMGNRRATQFIPLDNLAAAEVGQLAALASAADQTPEGKSIVDLYRRMPGGNPAGAVPPPGSRTVGFTAQTRMSGVDLVDGRVIRKGAPDAIIKSVQQQNGKLPVLLDEQVKTVAGKGATPLLVAEGNRIA